MKNTCAIIFNLFFLCSCTFGPSDFRPIHQDNKVSLYEDGEEEVVYWEFKEDERLWKSVGEIPIDLQLYRDSVNLALGVTAWKKAIYNEARQDLDKSLLHATEDGDDVNSLLIHTGTLGIIRPINYLEAEIINYQSHRFPMFSVPTEFHVFITRNDQLNSWRVYFCASNTEWPPHPILILKQLSIIQKDGWLLAYHLHNHYCKADRDYLGILAPSLADAQYYKMLLEKYQVEKSMITNGFHTVVIDREDFIVFASH